MLLTAQRKAELSLHEFIKQAWPVIEGDKEFVDGWHIEAICEHLEAVADRQIKNLIINLPPRCMKSTIVSISYPAWVWLQKPSEQFLYASYALSLSLRDSVKCRRLISSPWYQSRWGSRYKLVGDQNTKSRFDNTQKGYRIATSVGSAVTGEGGSFLIVDDPNNSLDGDSEVQRENKIDWWNQVWSTRLNDKKNDCRVVIQQRIHERDITGYILGSDDLNEWTKLILPMEFEEGRKSRTNVLLPDGEYLVWEDPRTEEGALLWPQRIDKKALNSLKQALGSSYAIAGQLQQRPSPEAGGIIKKDWFQWWKYEHIPTLEFTVQSWDLALNAKSTSSYSACTTWGVFYDEHNRENVILLSLWRGRLEYPELRNMAKRLYHNYRDTDSARDSTKKIKELKPDLVLIEAKASGDPLIADLNAAGIRAKPFQPSNYGDKIQRVRLVTPLIEGGAVWLPAKKPIFDRLHPFAEEMLEAAGSFPTADSRDLVDTMTQALLELKYSNFLLTPHDPRSFTKSREELDPY